MLASFVPFTVVWLQMKHTSFCTRDSDSKRHSHAQR
jgi:hypothetical protein